MRPPLPLPPRKRNEVVSKDGELTQNEYDFILSSTLKPAHRSEPTVISFIDAFVRCKNIAEASEEAGIHQALGYKYRNRKDISTAIQKLIDKSMIKYGFDASEIIERVKEVVDFDPIDLMNADGSYKSNMHDIPPSARRCLKKLKVKNLYRQEEDMNGIVSKIIIGEMIEYEFYDKLKASEMVGREKELFKNVTKVEHGLSKDMGELLLESSRRADQAIAAPPVTIEATYVDRGSGDDNEKELPKP